MDVSQNYKRLKHWPYLVAQKKKKNRQQKMEKMHQILK